MGNRLANRPALYGEQVQKRMGVACKLQVNVVHQAVVLAVWETVHRDINNHCKVLGCHNGAVIAHHHFTTSCPSALPHPSIALKAVRT